ncbi:MAG: hypothetical protein HXS47_08165 [Theionarchaea archaeon]|nr:hypothetical protein [Theionarchaea archaeon]
MPQLVKGGKYVFAWTVVGKTGEITIPDEAVEEYRFSSGPVFILTGSKRSGGFALVSPESLKKSPLGAIVKSLPQLESRTVPEGEPVYHKGIPYCWVQLHDTDITLPETTLTIYGIRPGDTLLVVRGSGLGPAVIVKGPIIEEAQTHPEIPWTRHADHR